VLNLRATHLQIAACGEKHLSQSYPKSTAVIDHRLTELERQVNDLNAKLLKLTPPEKNWQRLAGAFQDSPIFS
jgi:hypothetical protein